jgi:hypothetical protein
MPVETSQSPSTNSKKQLIPLSFLQSGSDLKITKNLSFKHPTIQEVFDIDKEHNGLYSEEIYYSMISVFLTDPYTHMVFLDDHGIDYEKSSSFEVFCLLFQDYNEKFMAYVSANKGARTEEQLLNDNLYFKAFKFFLGIDSFFLTKDLNGNFLLGYDTNKLLMESSVYAYISEFVQKMNGIPEPDKINPEDQWAKQILIEDERERLKKQAKEKDNDESKNRLGNLISAVTWACNGGITPFNRNQLHMYDLVDGIHRNDKLLNYKNTMIGLYSGCIDKKKINFKELHWSAD